VNDEGVDGKDREGDDQPNEIYLKTTDPFAGGLEGYACDRPAERSSEGCYLPECLNIQSLLAPIFSFTMVPTLMTIEQLVTQLLRYQNGFFIAFAAIPVAVFAVSFVHGVYDGREAPWRHIYALVVHLVTALMSIVGTLTVYHILEVGSPQRGLLLVVGASVVSWLLLLAVVKRAVDFVLIRSVRNPFALLFSWLLGWTVAGLLDFYGFLVVPGPRPLVLAGVAVVAFFLIRLVLRLLFGSRS
jgi:hypothetical protein